MTEATATPATDPIETTKPKRARKKAQATEAQATIKKAKASKLHGYIVAWSPREGSTYQYAEVLDALKRAGLPEEIARERLPRNAFARACKRLEEERMIHGVSESEESILFQFTRQHTDAEMDEAAIEFRRECKARLDKRTGKVAVYRVKDAKKIPLPELEAEVQTEVDRCMLERTASDITTVVQRLCYHHADLIPIRKSYGGAYFVPVMYGAFIDKISQFLEQLHGSLERWPIPVGDPSGDASVQKSVKAYMADVLADYTKEIDSFQMNSKLGTLEGCGERLAETKIKVEAYALYLQDEAAGLTAGLEENQQRLTKLVEELTAHKEAQKSREEPLPKDEFGNREGSNASAINSALNCEPMSMQELMQKAGIKATCYNHMKKLVASGVAVKTPDGKFKRANNG